MTEVPIHAMAAVEADTEETEATTTTAATIGAGIVATGGQKGTTATATTIETVGIMEIAEKDTGATETHVARATEATIALGTARVTCTTETQIRGRAHTRENIREKPLGCLHGTRATICVSIQEAILIRETIPARGVTPMLLAAPMPAPSTELIHTSEKALLIEANLMVEMMISIETIRFPGTALTPRVTIPRTGHGRNQRSAPDPWALPRVPRCLREPRIKAQCLKTDDTSGRGPTIAAPEGPFTDQNV